MKKSKSSTFTTTEIDFLKNIKIYRYLNKCIAYKGNLQILKDLFVIYMGRGVSKGCHFGHLFTWETGVNLAKITNSSILFSIADDEKKQTINILKNILEIQNLLGSLNYNKIYILLD